MGNDIDDVSWEDDMPDTNVKPAFLDLVAAAKRTRDRLLEREHWLDSKAIARAMRHEALVSDPARYADQLRRERRVFAVLWRGEHLYPAFQFQASGEVHPGMKQLLAALPTTDANWNAIFWLFERNGKVGGRRHADVFSEDPGLVIAAATEDFIHNDSEGTAAMP